MSADLDAPAYELSQPCSITSQTAGEALYGSAPVTQSWLLLEYPHAPAAQALAENRLPQAIQTALVELTRSQPGLRLLLVRNERSARAAGIWLAAGTAGEAPALFEYRLDSYADLLGLDLAAAISGQPQAGAALLKEPFLMVCTNGKRDACCARLGVPLYQALQTAGFPVWQASHVAGHRFAPNLVSFPWGVYYGRLPLEDSRPLAEAILAGEMPLGFLRGRACYPPVQQAAEFFLRRHTGERQVVQYTALPAPDALTAVFADRHSLARWQVRLESAPADFAIYESCGSHKAVYPAQFKPRLIERV
jgi:hypothetical protein